MSDIINPPATIPKYRFNKIFIGYIKSDKPDIYNQMVLSDIGNQPKALVVLLLKLYCYVTDKQSEFNSQKRNKTTKFSRLHF